MPRSCPQISTCAGVQMSLGQLARVCSSTMWIPGIKIQLLGLTVSKEPSHLPKRVTFKPRFIPLGKGGSCLLSLLPHNKTNPGGNGERQQRLHSPC